MGELAGILFEVDAADAHQALALRGEDGEAAVPRQGLLVLRDLVALGQVGIEVVLAGEDAGGVDLAAQRQGDAQAVLDGALVDDGQDAGHAGADRADGDVGLRHGGIDDAAGAEHLRAGIQLGVDFQSDDGFVFHGHGRLDQRAMAR